MSDDLYVSSDAVLTERMVVGSFKVYIGLEIRAQLLCILVVLEI